MIYCDPEKCVGCRMCEVACSSFHSGDAVSPALSRIRIAKLEEIGIETAVTCISCLEKPCLECPNEALSVGELGQIRTETTLCGGCGVCVEACPIGAAGYYDNLPLFCDLCGGAASCVQVCPSAALSNRPEYRNASLNRFMEIKGNPAQKRAAYAGVLGQPLRENWKRGGRVNP